MRRVRFIAFAACVTAGAAVQAQTRMTVSVRGNPAGYATLSQQIQKDGVKVVSLRLELGSGDRVVRLSTEARYDAAGLPLRKFQTTVVSNGELERQTIATFGKSGAEVIVLNGERRDVKKVGLVETAPRATPSEFWFIRDQPKKGETERAYQFNLDKLAWELVTTEYRGKKHLKILDRTVSVHEVMSERDGKQTTAYLDDQGLPVLIDQGEIKMVKIWPK